MEQKALTFDKQCICIFYAFAFANKCIFLNKKSININKVDFRKIVLSRKDSYRKKGLFKYFIGYINEADAFPAPLCIKIPQMNEYAKYLLVLDEDLSKNTTKYGTRLVIY